MRRFQTSPPVGQWNWASIDPLDRSLLESTVCHRITQTILETCNQLCRLHANIPLCKILPMWLYGRQVLPMWLDAYQSLPVLFYSRLRLREDCIGVCRILHYYRRWRLHACCL